MKKLHVAAAVASLFAAGSAMAATISQSGVTVAREVIAVNSQSIIGPAASFTYAGNLSANAASSQDFNLVLKLGGDGAPAWLQTAGNLPNLETMQVKAFVAGSPVNVPVLAAGTTAAGKAAVEVLEVEAVDAQTLRVKFRLENKTAVPVNLTTAQVNFNVTTAAIAAATVGGVDFDAQPAPAAAKFAKVTNLVPTVGTVDSDGASEIATDVCSDGDKRVSLNIRNYTGSGVGVIGESGEAGVTNNGYILFSQALNVIVGKGVAVNRSTNPATENKALSTDTAGFGTTTTMPLGYIKFRNLNVDAWDTDIATDFYKLRANNVNNNGDLNTLTVLNTDGAVDTLGAVVKLMSSNGFAAGSTITLSNSPFCSATGANNVSAAGTAVASNGGKDWTVTFTHADLVSIVTGGAVTNTITAIGDALATGPLGAGADPVAGYTATTDRAYICYNVPGNVEIPQSTFTGLARLTKEVGANEQTNQSCVRELAGLGGGVKIDVRNFLGWDPAKATTEAYGEWINVVRVINNSETQEADLIGQYIRADGKYGKWGEMGTLPARGARYFTAKEVHNLLLNNSSTNGADNTGPGGLTAASGQELAANTRLRISSTKAATLRVQNYFYNTRTGALTEVSGSQGADFVNLGASPRDHIDQDAQTGIKK
ncbi:hypothetical protein HNQ51_001797 [Inhella inkyongensis]|uniref:Uncharacterized protein n=2 Tax=Inhella inkyongensis TaxID=392593 RepID=A0A840S437_9BURK|nr:hypothetical protein [Inhella inkyongensis]MBB5204483.1 hypothetical protein [Inhella inkyongensis]